MLPYLATGVSAAMETKWELVSMAAETTLVMKKIGCLNNFAIIHY